MNEEGWSLEPRSRCEREEFSGPHKDIPGVTFFLRPVHEQPLKTSPLGATVDGLPLEGFVLLSLLLNHQKIPFILGQQWTNDKAS